MLVVVLVTVGWVIVGGSVHVLAGAGVRLSRRTPSRSTARCSSSVGAASVLAMYSYGGYNQVCNIGEEIRIRRARSRARSSSRSSLVAVLYILMTTVIIGMIPWQEVRDSRTVASVFIARTFSDPDAGRIAGIVMTGLILFVAAASLYATILGYSRVPFAAARDGDFFRVIRARPPDQALPACLAGRRLRSSRSRSASSRSVSS